MGVQSSVRVDNGTPLFQSMYWYLQNIYQFFATLNLQMSFKMILKVYGTMHFWVTV